MSCASALVIVRVVGAVANAKAVPVARALSAVLWSSRLLMAFSAVASYSPAIRWTLPDSRTTAMSAERGSMVSSPRKLPTAMRWPPATGKTLWLGESSPHVSVS